MNSQKTIEKPIVNKFIALLQSITGKPVDQVKESIKVVLFRFDPDDMFVYIRTIDTQEQYWMNIRHQGVYIDYYESPSSDEHNNPPYIPYSDDISKTICHLFLRNSYLLYTLYNDRFDN